MLSRPYHKQKGYLFTDITSNLQEKVINRLHMNVKMSEQLKR